MKVRRDLSEIDPQQGCVLSIGNFDGVHVGHQSMIACLDELSTQDELPSVLMTFEPHPMEMLKPDLAPARLTRFREKMAVLRQLPSRPDMVICKHFNQKLSRMSARQFIQQILVEGFGVRHLLVGHDFQFGLGGLGNVDLLREAAAEHGFNFDCFSTVEHQGTRISSTRIRTALVAGDLNAAAVLLGRPYSLCGRVRRGRQLGRQLGFPTVNISPGRNYCSLSGVFAVNVYRGSGGPFPGVANVGNRPTIDGLQEQIEVHLFDFNEDIYGDELKVEFLHHIRAEQRFNGLEELKHQISLDARAARSFLKV